ncbi:MAG: hypothetical protein ABSC23_13605 [Bryobacteraceae bacterium]
MITINLIEDWAAFLRGWMPLNGLQYDEAQSVRQNTERYLNAIRRIVHPQPRRVHESKELRVPELHTGDYAVLKALIERGDDIRDYLSRDIVNERAARYDRLLNAWGIQHLHFRPCGTRDVLFAKITDTEVYVIQALPHGRCNEEVWAEPSLLQILHDNWPGALGVGSTGLHAESLTGADRLKLWKANINFITTVADGTSYVAPGGGLTTSGQCVFDARNCDRIFADLDGWRRTFEANEQELRTALNIPPADQLAVKAVFEGDGHGIGFYVPSRNIMLSFRLRE